MTEVEQRCVNEFLDAKKFTLIEIAAELASVDGEQAYAKKAVEYLVHQVKLGKTMMEDEMKMDRQPLDDVARRILTCLRRELSFTVRPACTGDCPSGPHDFPGHETPILPMSPSHVDSRTEGAARQSFRSAP
jgi:hypothetical protein